MSGTCGARLGEVHLARDLLELLLRDVARVREDRELVARERHVGEDVADDVAEGGHGATPATAVRLPLNRVPMSSAAGTSTSRAQ